MGKTTDNTHSFDKIELIKSLRKKNLKRVLYKNKYLPNDSESKKSQLIKELLYKERINLNLHYEENYNLCSSDEEIIAEGEIIKLLEEKKSNLFTTRSELDAIKPPPQVIQAITQLKEMQKEEKVTFPVIPKNKIDKLFSLLSTKQTLSDYQNKINRCLSNKMRILERPIWNSSTCVMKVLNDSLLQRKWDHIPHLLQMLIPPRSNTYNGVVRDMFAIMAKLHPTFHESGLQKQFEILLQVHRKNK